MRELSAVQLTAKLQRVERLRCDMLLLRFVHRCGAFTCCHGVLAILRLGSVVVTVVHRRSIDVILKKHNRGSSDGRAILSAHYVGCKPCLISTGRARSVNEKYRRSAVLEFWGYYCII